MSPSPIPVWGNLFMLFFAVAWVCRCFILPYMVSQRLQRPFKYGFVSSEERKGLTLAEKKALFAVNLFGALGLATFIAVVAITFYNVYTGNWKHL